MQPLRDLYADLELGPGAGKGDIKKAWRRCALKWHPDRHPDDPEAAEKFKAASNAYHILIDDAARRRYDNYVWPHEDATRWDVDPSDIWGTLERDAIVLRREAEKQRRSRGRGRWKTYRASSGRVYHTWSPWTDEDLFQHYRERARGWEGEEARAAWHRARRRRPHHRPGMIWPQLEEANGSQRRKEGADRGVPQGPSR